MTKILVVDDEPINQQVLKNHLSQKEFHITPAMNGEEAIKTLEKDTFDLVPIHSILATHNTFSPSIV